MNAPGNLAQVTPALRSLDLIHTLVGYDTTSRDSNLALIDWIRDYLEGHGFTAALTFDDDRRKANLFATLAAVDGNATQGGIVLSGHTDVVPVDDQPWESDPFTVTMRDGRLYGRGVTDMKSFSAVGLAFVPEFVRRGVSEAAALRALVRRGSRLHRRAQADRRHRRARRPSRRVHRRRADRHGARRRAQGQEGVALPRPRLRGAFVVDAERRQRGADRVRDRCVHRKARA